MASDNPDLADLNKQGKPQPDAKTNVRPIALNVPRVLTVKDLLEASVIKLKEAKGSNCSTGHLELDRITGGFRPGFTWLFGATTSWGKSSFLVQITDDAIRAGKRVLIVSSEDTEEVYGDRLMVRRARVDAMAYRDKKLDALQLHRVADVARRAEELPVFVDARRYPVEDLIGHLTNIIREHRVDLVAFDYVQEFRSKRRFQDERVKFREISSMLRHVAKDSKISGILFSQLTTGENTKIPTRDNIRECRDMAHAAEVIVLGFEPPTRLDIGGGRFIEPGTKCVFVDKVKNGPRNRVVQMDWNESLASFESHADQERRRIEHLASVGREPNSWEPGDEEGLP
jgi:replicative DNA helicase